MIYRILFTTLLVMVVAVSCEENTEMSPAKRTHLQKVQITSLSREPQLERALDIAGFIKAGRKHSANGRANDAGAEIDIDNIIQVLQDDSIHQTFTFKISDEDEHSFSNLIVQELTEGYLGFILKYEFEGNFLGMDRFTGTLTRFDLEGNFLNDGNFVNGELVQRGGSASGKTQQETQQCLAGSSTSYECAKWVVFTTDPEPQCSKWVTVVTLEYEDCPSPTGPPPVHGPIPPSGGGTYVPPTSGSGSTPSTPTPVDDVNGGNDVQPIPGYKPIAVVPEDEIEETVNNLLEEDPTALLEIDCNQLPKWQALAQHKPNQVVKDRLNNVDEIFVIGDVEMQAIQDASGTVVNMDYFPVTISQLPNKPNSTQKFTAPEFLEHIRKNINSFLDTQYSEFSPSTITGLDEAGIWNSTNPVGAIIHIEIPSPAGDGSVICSAYNQSQWIFSTIEMPYKALTNGYDGEHPVSGNREFGYTQNTDGSFTFYTRGVDRITASFDAAMAETFMSETYFKNADALWTSFKNGIYNYVTTNSGQATTPTSKQNSVNRPDWEKVRDVLNGTKPISDLGCK